MNRVNENSQLYLAVPSLTICDIQAEERKKAGGNA